MQRKILEQVIITKKSPQRKTLHILKTNVFELLNTKNIGQLFHFWTISNVDTTIPLPYSFPASLAISVKFPPGQLKPLFNAILILFFINFRVFSYPIRSHATITGYTKPYDKPSQSNLWSSYIQIIIPFWSNTLPIKKLSL